MRMIESLESRRMLAATVTGGTAPTNVTGTTSAAPAALQMGSKGAEASFRVVDGSLITDVNVALDVRQHVTPGGEVKPYYIMGAFISQWDDALGFYRLRSQGLAQGMSLAELGIRKAEISADMRTAVLDVSFPLEDALSGGLVHVDINITWTATDRAPAGQGAAAVATGTLFAHGSADMNYPSGNIIPVPSSEAHLSRGIGATRYESFAALGQVTLATQSAAKELFSQTPVLN